MPTLGSRGEALLELLPELLGTSNPQITSAGDEVVALVEPVHLLETGTTLKEHPRLAFDYLRCLSVVDYEESFQIVYHLWSLEHRHKMVLKVNIAYEEPRVPSVFSIWRSADWFEREGRDLFGVFFEGHPDLKPLLLWEGFEGYPGRKAFPFHEYTEY